MFQLAFLFRLARILLYSDFAGTDYPHQARHHCIIDPAADTANDYDDSNSYYNNNLVILIVLSSASNLN